MDDLSLKISYVHGLHEIVLAEIAQYPNLVVQQSDAEELYLNFVSDFSTILNLKSITNAYVVVRNDKVNPYFISNHKSILGGLVEKVLSHDKKSFKTFAISCAGSDSPEVKEIEKYISETFKLEFTDHDVDMKISIGKSQDLWEIAIAMTPRPLSVRPYKIENLKGAVNPTIAYAMNTFCHLNIIESYLNICSGSGTLLIEAGLENPNLKLVGFDIDGKTNALAVQNIKKAGLIKKISLTRADLLDKPNLGTFDAIVSDVPFGMLVSKHQDLNQLYTTFVSYCENTLNPGGTLVAYTSEYELLTPLLEASKFKIEKILQLKLTTSVGAYLHPQIIVCRFKK